MRGESPGPIFRSSFPLFSWVASVRNVVAAASCRKCCAVGMKVFRAGLPNMSLI